MGNRKFRLSDMIPNAWFYKLKEMGRTRKQSIRQTKQQKYRHPPTSSSSSSSLPSSTATSIPPQKTQPNLLSQQRKSNYFKRELTSSPKFQTRSPKSTELPKKSPKQRRGNKASKSKRLVTSSSVSTGCGCRATVESASTKPDSIFSEDYLNSPLDSSSDLESLLPEIVSGRPSDPFHTGVENNLPIDKNCKFLKAKFDEINPIAELELPPIITKNLSKHSDSTQEKPKCRKIMAEFEGRNHHGSLSVKIVKEQRSTPVVRRLSVSSPGGVRIRTNSPRIANLKVQGRKSVSSSCGRRRSLSESFAVVKSSADPQRDFKESMEEMIVENNIRASKDLEDLLACYLQLNSDEYHGLIIKVFKQIWFDLADVRLK